MVLDIRRFEIPDVVEIKPHRFEDERGFFSETFNAGELRRNGIEIEWLQDNHTLSTEAGVVRGLHYQLNPFAQGKLVRVARGSVFDVAVDLRSCSPSFGQWVGVELSATVWNQLYIPAGFAHGYMALEAQTEVIYKVSSPYAPEYERSIRYDDPTIGIRWPLESNKIILSEKDQNAPEFNRGEINF